ACPRAAAQRWARCQWVGTRPAPATVPGHHGGQEDAADSAAGAVTREPGLPGCQQAPSRGDVAPSDGEGAAVAPRWSRGARGALAGVPEAAGGATQGGSVLDSARPACRRQNVPTQGDGRRTVLGTQ